MTLEQHDQSGWADATKGQSLFVRARHSSRIRLLILAALALFLLWEVLTRSFTAYLADASPQEALRLRSTNPTALLNLAEDTLSLDESFKDLAPVLTPPRSPGSSYAKGVDSQELELAETSELPSGANDSPQSADSDQTSARIRSWAELALHQAPLSARAFRILGQISERASDAERTQALMQAAIHRSALESVAVYWMMRKSYSDRDYSAALRFADTLLRTRPQTLMYVMPIFGKIAEVPNASPDLKQLLATNPPWRRQFFDYFPKTVSDARTPLDLLLSLKDTSNPPRAEDLQAYLNFLIQHGFYDLAYYTWLQFLPPEQLAKAGHLFNGTFDVAAAPSGAPFDWRFTQESGVAIQLAARPDQPRGRALSLAFGSGRVDYRDVTQLIMLSFGTYKFRGNYKSDLISERGLEWRVTCVKGPLLGQSEAVRGSSSGWKDFAFSFTVPQLDCPAQYVRLVFGARSASERFISGSIWYDDLQIVREQAVGSPGASVDSLQ